MMKENFSWDWAGAEKEYRRAAELNSNYPTTHHWYALFLCQMKRNDDAIREGRVAQSLDPLSPIINTMLGLTLLSGGQYDGAVAQWKRTLELDPNFPEAHFWLAKAYSKKGLYADSIDEAQKAAERSGRAPRYVAVVGEVTAAAGKKAEAHAMLDELLRTSKSRHVSPYHIAGVYSALGERDQTFAFLENAWQTRDDQLNWIVIDPAFDSIRSDPRYSNLVRRLGLPE